MDWVSLTSDHSANKEPSWCPRMTPSYKGLKYNFEILQTKPPFLVDLGATGHIPSLISLYLVLGFDSVTHSLSFRAVHPTKFLSKSFKWSYSDSKSHTKKPWISGTSRTNWMTPISENSWRKLNLSTLT